MVKENGMIMMNETEYNELQAKIRDLDYKYDLAKMELATYHRSMRALADKNLGKNETEDYGIEIPAGDFADMIDKMVCDHLDDDSCDGIEQMEDKDLWFAYNGFSCRIPFGCACASIAIPAIKETYEEYNS